MKTQLSLAYYKSPCKNCKERHVACHDECDKYKGYVKKNAEMNKKIKEENSVSTDKGWSYTRKKK